MKKSKLVFILMLGAVANAGPWAAIATAVVQHGNASASTAARPLHKLFSSAESTSSNHIPPPQGRTNASGVHNSPQPTT